MIKFVYCLQKNGVLYKNKFVYCIPTSVFFCIQTSVCPVYKLVCVLDTNKCVFLYTNQFLYFLQIVFFIYRMNLDKIPILRSLNFIELITNWNRNHKWKQQHLQFIRTFNKWNQSFRSYGHLKLVKQCSSFTRRYHCFTK